MAKIDQDKEQQLLIKYVTDGIMAISKNTACLSKEGMELLKEFSVVAGWKKVAPERSGDEIADDVIKRAGLTVVK